MKFTWKKLIFALLLVTFGVVGRYLLLPLPNVESMTAITLLAGALLGGGYTIAVPLAAVAIFDLFYGNSPILLFTWSAWAMVGFFGLILHGRNWNRWKFTAGLTGLGIISNLFFYFWTNFGVWFIGGWYPKTATGLVTCFIAGLPFLKYQVLGNLLVVPITSVIFYYLWQKMPYLGKIRVKKEERNHDTGQISQ